MTGRRTSDDAGARVHDDPSLSSGNDVRSSTIFVGPASRPMATPSGKRAAIANNLIDFQRFRKGSVLVQREDDHAGRERNPTGEDHRGSPTSEQVGRPRSRSRRLGDHRETEKKYREPQRDYPKRALGDFREKLLWRQPGDIDAENMMRYRRRGRLGSCRPSFDSAQIETKRGRERRSSAADVALLRRRDKGRRADGGVEDRDGHAEQPAASDAQPDLIRPARQRLPANTTVEAEAVDAGVAAHCEMANDLTEREDFDHGEPNPSAVAKAEHENRKASRFRAVQVEEGLGLRRCVTAGGGALKPPDEAVNILAAAEPDVAEPSPPDVPLCGDGIVPSRVELAEFGAVVRLVGAVLGTTVVIFGVVVTFGSVVVTFGSVVVTFGSVVVTFGNVVVTFGSVVVTRQRRRHRRQRRRDLRKRCADRKRGRDRRQRRCDP